MCAVWELPLDPHFFDSAQIVSDLSESICEARDALLAQVHHFSGSQVFDEVRGILLYSTSGGCETRG